jgi:hypothetical protein
MAAIYSNGDNRWNILGFNFTKRDALSSVYKISMAETMRMAETETARNKTWHWLSPGKICVDITNNFDNFWRDTHLVLFLVVHGCFLCQVHMVEVDVAVLVIWSKHRTNKEVECGRNINMIKIVPENIDLAMCLRKFSFRKELNDTQHSGERSFSKLKLV